MSGGGKWMTCCGGPGADYTPGRVELGISKMFWILLTAKEQGQDGHGGQMQTASEDRGPPG